MTEEDAKALEVRNNELVSVEVVSDRPVTFRGVVVRVSNDFSLKCTLIRMKQMLVLSNSRHRVN